MKFPATLGFGEIHTDRIFTQTFDDGAWSNPQIIPVKKFPILPPSTTVLHYGQGIFEGLKAYCGQDSKIRLFRPLDNAIRFNASAARMVMPEYDAKKHVSWIKKLVSLERDWVPTLPETSLYIRPTMIATDPYLGLHPSKKYLHFITLCLAGNYFADGFTPIGVKIETKQRRVAVGGTGEAKTMGNYAASLLATAQAQQEGYTQVLWLDPEEGRYIEEVGAMNIFFVTKDGTLLTPKLSGSILSGITRKSILHMAPDLGHKALEVELDVVETVKAIKDKSIVEVFGSGTAAVIASIGHLGFNGKDYQVADGQVGPITARLRKYLTDIQYGRVKDPYGWTEVVK